MKILGPEAPDPRLWAGLYADRLVKGARDKADAPALAWRRAGLMDVTGLAEGPGLVCPLALASAADGAMLALKHLVPEAQLPLNGALLLGERARLLGLSRQGRTSANGSCRLLDTLDGRIALNLARDDDWGLLPALVEDAGACDWDSLAALVARWPTDELVARGAELGLAIAADRPAVAPKHWVVRTPGATTRRRDRPLVLDLSSLWAGPLAGSLLAMLGADVTKLESAARPDGARGGHAGFFALLNGMKHHESLDFADHSALAKQMAAADIIIEGSRPRALAQLGIDARREVARGAIWISITGHGRSGADAMRVGFGDDAAVAGGLASAMARAWGAPMFAGDAIADPLTGIHAAVAGWQAWQAERGALLALSLRRTVAFAARSERVREATLAAWQAAAAADTAPLYPLRVPPC